MPNLRFLRPMTPRDPDEIHRAATPLELFFDLTFVVAVAEATTTVHHELVAGDGGDALLAYPVVFFAIWWAWMNFTWFASAYDTDDVVYRLAVFAQMVGVLVFATGVPRFITDLDPSIAVVGYVIMRIPMAGQWLRAAASDPAHRRCGRRYAVGILMCQVGWVLLAIVADGGWWVVGAALGAAAELSVPVWAERDEPTTWHPTHIGERYGLFTIIVLGESVLSVTLAVQQVLDTGGHAGELIKIASAGVIVVASLWWIYFDQPVEHVLTRARMAFINREYSQSFLWGYGHYFVFASVAAAGVGLAVAVDQATTTTALSDVEAGLTLTIPVAVYVLAIWLLHARSKAPSRFRTFAAPVTAALVLASTWTPAPALATGVILVGLVALALVVHAPEPSRRVDVDSRA